MATGALEDISDELKTQYPPGSRIFEDPVNLQAPYRKSLAKTELVANEGGVAQLPLGIARAWNVGSGADISAMTAPIDPTRVQGSVSPELFYGSFQLGVKTRALAKSQKSTFNVGGVLKTRLDDTLKDLGKYMNQVYAGSNRGRMAVIESVSANAFVAALPQGTGLLNKNLRISIFDALTGGAVRTDANARKITVIDKKPGGTRAVTYDGADVAAAAPGDHVFVHGSYGRTHWSLRDIVDDGNECLSPFGKSRNTYPELKAVVHYGTNGRRDLTEQLILNIIAEISDSTGQYVTRALANSGQGRKFVEFIQPDRRYPGATTGAPKYTVGYDDTSLSIVAPGVNCRLECDTDVVPRSMFFLTWGNFGRYEGMPLDWMDEGELLRLVPTEGGYKAGFLAYVAAIENQVCTMLAANGRLTDLNDPLCGD
jgi:hypothetical protein